MSTEKPTNELPEMDGFYDSYRYNQELVLTLIDGSTIDGGCGQESENGSPVEWWRHVGSGAEFINEDQILSWRTK